MTCMDNQPCEVAASSTSSGQALPKRPEERTIKRIFLMIAFVWTFLVAMLATMNYRHFHATTLEIAVAGARHTYSRDLVYRRWVTGHGGVYVPITPETPPNPYLAHIPERDIVTLSGKKLTLMNPAYMTRQVHELGLDQYGLRGHITSLRPIRPENAPDAWEKEALLAFERGETETASLEPIDEKTYLRFIRPMIVEQGCLACHAQQGYALGDIRGGISVSVPWEASRRGSLSHLRTTMLSFGMIWLIGLAGLWFSRSALLKDLFERRRTEGALQKAFNDIRTLHGIVPICANCKKIRDDQGYWEQVEVYVHNHTEADFSHSICPECMKKLYPEFEQDDNENAPEHSGGPQ